MIMHVGEPLVTIRETTTPGTYAALSADSARAELLSLLVPDPRFAQVISNDQGLTFELAPGVKPSSAELELWFWQLSALVKNPRNKMP